jgi:phosphotriesterase-related protein
LAEVTLVYIQTVSGPVGSDELGAVLMHEHVETVALPGFHSGGREDADDLTRRALAGLPDRGFRTLVDLTGRTRVAGGHDYTTLQRIASSLPLHVVVGFSYYKDPWLETSGDGNLDRLTSVYVDQAGGAGGVPVGIYGEVGTSLDEITPGEKLHLRAAARAHLDTGLAVSTHCTLGTMALEQVAILEAEGADLGRVVIGHLDLKPDVAYLDKVLATGVNIGFDTFGKEWFDYRVPDSENAGQGAFVKWAYHRPDEDRFTALAELCRRGHDGRIVLSCDMSGAEAWLNPTTHGRHGYSYLPDVVLPRLRQLGVTETSLRRMTIDNPARILAVP